MEEKMIEKKVFTKDDCAKLNTKDTFYEILTQKQNKKVMPKKN